MDDVVTQSPATSALEPWPLPELGLHPGEEPAAGLARVLSEQMELVGKVLAAPDAELAPAVHVARKTLKKVRALLKMVASPGSSDPLATASRAFRDAGRTIAPLRDADVLLLTARKLGSENVAETAVAAWTALEEALTRARDGTFEDASDLMAAAREHVAVARAALDGWSPGGSGFDAVRGGITTSYGGARTAMEAACGGQSARAFHEWRKRCKDVRHQLELLAPLSGEVEARCADLHALTDLLGEANDLENLEAWIRTWEGSPMEVRQGLVELPAQRRGQLWVEACDLALRLHASEPDAYAGWLEALWTVSTGTAGGDGAQG